MLCGLATAGHAAHLGDAFWLGLAGTGAHLAWQARPVSQLATLFQGPMTMLRLRQRAGWHAGHAERC